MSLVLQGLRCEWGAGVLNLVLSLSLILVTGSSTWHLMTKNSLRKLSEKRNSLKKRIVTLHKDGVGYKKIAKTLKMSCSTVTKRFNRTGSTQNRLCHGLPKKLSARAQCPIQRLCLGRGWMGGGSACQCSDHTPHTATNWSAWLSPQKEASSKDDAQESPQTVC